MVYWKTTGNSYTQFPAVVRPWLVKTLLWFDYLPISTLGAPAELAFIWF